MVATEAKSRNADKPNPMATFTLPRYLLDWLTEESERVGKKKSQLVKEALIVMRDGSDDSDTQSQAA